VSGRKKTAVQTVAALVPQPHGGALLTGGKPGNKGGGRPADKVRAKLVKLARGKGYRFLSSLLDGEVDVRFFGTCAKCKERQELPDDPDTLDKILDEIGDRVAASVDQRLRGLEQAHRYGLGTKDELDIESHPEVQKLVSNLAQAVVEVFGVEGYRRVSDRIVQLEKAS
jgi:hypothetical protein